MQSITYIEYKEKPKLILDNYFELYKEDKEYYDLMLVKVDISYEIKYFYYIIKLFKNINQNNYD